MEKDDYLLYVCTIMIMGLSAYASFLTKNRVLFNLTIAMLLLWILVAMFVNMTLKILILLIMVGGLIIVAALVSMMRYDLTAGRKKREKLGGSLTKILKGF